MRRGEGEILNLMLDAALDYARQGLPVFPCREKKPITPRGFLDASTDELQIQKWWTATPNAQIGMPTGRASHILSVDLDTPAAAQHLEELEAKFGELPRTRHIQTSPGRRQIHFRINDDVYAKSCTGFHGVNGFDVRGTGGYTILPPSRHHRSGRPYAILIDAPLADAPQWLLQQLAPPLSTRVNGNGTEAIPEGQRNNKLTSLAGSMQRVGMSEFAIRQALLAENRKRCRPPLSDVEVEGIAKSISRYEPAAKDGGNREALQGFIETQPEWAESPRIETQPDPSNESDTLPEFPRLRGPIDDFIRGITSDLPYEHKALCALVYLGVKISGRVRLASDPHLQPRLYGCMVGPPGTGKTASEKEVRRELEPLLDDVHCEFSIDSGPALVETLQEFPRLVYTPDEMADAFEKARHTPASRNSLFGEFLRLFDSNSTGRRVLKKNSPPISLTDVHFAMIGGATPERFNQMWTGTSGAAGGLQSRYSLSYSETPMPNLRTPNSASTIETAIKTLKENLRIDGYVKISEAAQDLIVKTWTATFSSRALDTAKRFALLLAASESELEVDADLMQAALQFARYQIAVHEKLMPPDSHGWVQSFENRIIAYFKRHRQSTERDLRRSLSPEKYPGGYGSFSQAIRNLLTCHKLVSVGSNQKGNAIWELD
jgi:hypothetical protein